MPIKRLLHFLAAMARKTLMRTIAPVMLAVLACCSSASFASGVAPLEGERLSDWMLRQATSDQSFSLGLSWQVPSERAEQLKLQNEVLMQLANAPQSVSSFSNLVRALPITGRVRIPVPDARWIQAHPKYDPILSAEQQLTLPQRPNTVAVLTSDGVHCVLPHQAGAQARDYLNACMASATGLMSAYARAWVIQPDGLVMNYGIASWNEEAQAEVAPGGIVWADASEVNRPSKLSQTITAFLATQTYDTMLSVAEPLRVKSVAKVARISQARNLSLTANDWGMVGLLQTPTARMSPEGESRFNMSRVYPYERINVMMQPFENLEAGFRYTTVVNRLYGSADASGTQPYKDKSLDLKLRLLDERAYLPQVSAGVIDLAGTGLFSSEYLVANKRFGNVDASLGMAWGYLGASGNIRNPLTLVSSKFATRSADYGMGGIPGYKSFFRGPSALFGGIQYQAPWQNWVLKAEYDGNNYRNEPQSNNRKQITPFNFGVVYRPSPSIDLSMGVERGNTVMFGLTLHTSLSQMSAPKVSDAPTPKIAATRPLLPGDLTATAADISAMSGWGVQKLASQGKVLQVVLEGASGVHWNERMERIVAVLHRDAPAGIDTFELILTEQGVVLTERVVHREAWVQQNTSYVVPSAKQVSMAPAVPRSNAELKTVKTIWEPTPASFGYSVVPSWQQNIGGPDGFLLFRAGVSVPMRWRITDNVSVSGAVSLNLVDNFANFKYTAPSEMPRVRTYLREYMTESRVNIPNLQITHFGQAFGNQYYSAYAGYLESMFAGVGGEWLYRQWHSPYAFGVDINRVQQRNFNQHFGLDGAGTQTGYRVTTGHATAYWETGWQSTNVKLSAGRYLAGDVGATVDVGKTFSNGVSVGAWLTKTNVSAQRFGEGSFDKGLYLRIPFDVMTTTRSGNVANLVYSPLTRDGGARLNRDFPLYYVTNARSARETGYAPAPSGPLLNLP
jgi:Exopolysaccharide biosynthesis protein YbjH/Capsule biosynthesis GfcC